MPNWEERIRSEQRAIEELERHKQIHERRKAEYERHILEDERENHRE